jgi:hypothetical protein
MTGWVARLRDVLERGESPATPALVAAAVLAVVIPVVALVMSAAIMGNHLASHDTGPPHAVHASGARSGTDGPQRLRRCGSADGCRRRPER